MAFTLEEIQEFMTEAEELLDAGEKALLALDQGSQLSANYDAIFRTFHSIKGAAGMMELDALQGHMHQLENLLTQYKGKDSLPKEAIDLFFRGSDAARTILGGGTVQFSYELSEASESHADAEKTTHSPQVTAIAQQSTSIQQRYGKVIVVDDEPESLDYLVDILVESGFEVASFNKPKEALEYFGTHGADTILTNPMMPELSGLDLLQAVKEQDADTPVIFISGHVTKEVMLKSIELGIHGVVEKPFSENHVVQLCHTACKRAQLSRLLNKSINLLLYQFSDLDTFLKNQGQDEIRRILKKEVETLLERRQSLKSASRSIKST